MRVVGLQPGDYTISQTTVPEGHQQAPDQTFTVQPGQRTRVDIVNEPAPGSIEVTIADATSGQPVGGACITSDGFSGEFCDNAEGDANTADGVIRVDGVVPGTYTVSISTAPEGFGPAEGLAQAQVTVESGAVATATLNVAQQLGTLSVTVTDPDGNTVPGACISATNNETGETIEICDNDGQDQDPSDGAITVAGVQPGDYSVVVTSVPEGYVAPEIAGGASVPAGGDGSASLPLTLVPPTETPTEVPTETETATEVPTETETATEEATATEVAT